LSGDAAPPPTTPPPPDPDLVRARYLEQLLAPDARGAWGEIAGALDAGIAPGRLYLEVLTPAMVEVGRLWETAQIGVAQEQIATQITQTVLARLASALEHEVAQTARLALVSGTPHELHAIGARMVADFLEAAGWEVLLLGPDAPQEEIVAVARDRRPDVVALSTSLSFNLLAAGRVFSALRAQCSPPPLLVAGGRAYEDDGERARLMGADVFAADPETLIAELGARLPARAAR
jgi:methanogenic corrinoid protein MtbC1